MNMSGGTGIFSIPNEHFPGFIALISLASLLLLITILINMTSRYDFRIGRSAASAVNRVPVVGRVAIATMVIGAGVHAAIVPTHWNEERSLAILFILDAVGFAAASIWVALGGAHWKAVSLAMLGGTVAGYGLYLALGWETGDVVGLVTTAIEFGGAVTVIFAIGRVRAWADQAGPSTVAVAITPLLIVAVLASAAVLNTMSPELPSAAAGQAASHSATGTAMGAMDVGSSPGNPNSSGGTANTTPDMPGMGGTPTPSRSKGSAGSSSSMPSMPGMGGASPATGSHGSTATTMPGMPGMGSGGSTATTMPGMPGMGSGGSTATTMPGMPGMGGSSNTISIPTNSLAGPIIWPMPMAAMEMEPGMAMVTPNCTATPTKAQQDAALTLVNTTVADVAPYRSLSYAKAHGYFAVTPTGQPVVHYMNLSYLSSTLDPTAIGSLVYANTSHGAVLVAAMYMLPLGDIGMNGPQPGGCLNEWHIHTNLCYSITTGLVVNLTNSAGKCPAGEENHVTSPMMHVWVAPVEDGPLVVDVSDQKAVAAAEALPFLSSLNGKA